MMHHFFRLFAAAVWLTASLHPVVAQGQPAPPAGEVSFPDQVQLGNIFTVGEKAAIKAAVQSGTSVDWTVTDFDNKQVASGTTPVTNHDVVITTGADAPGYYVVSLVSKNGGNAVGDAKTSYAVVPKFDLATMADSKFGVMTHFGSGMPIDVMPLMAKAGISWIRDEQFWAGVEKVKGTYEFPEMYTAYMAEAKRLHITPLLDATFGNTLYGAQPKVPVYKLAPYTPEGFDAYANYCVAVLQHYPDQYNTIEIWNEYNGTFCAGEAAKDRPKSYEGMLEAAYTKIKAARPDVTVLGAATVKLPIPYLEKLFKLGALNYMDGIAVHPYQSPETVEKSFSDLIALTKKYNNGKSKPIWATEMGHGDKSQDRAEAASHLIRMMTLECTFPEVQRIVWYLCRDFREFTNMGLVRGDQDPMGKFTPTMTYAAYSNLIHLLYHAPFAQHEKTDDRTCVYRFEGADRTVWVCWSKTGNTQVNFTTDQPLQFVNMVGGATPLPFANSQVSVSVGETPFYVVAPKGAVTAVAETPRKDELITESMRDFSNEQGKNGWSYYYYASNKDGTAPYDPEKVVAMSWVPSTGDWDDVWSGPGKWFSLTEGSASPSTISGGQGWAVRRWTSDRSGPIHLRIDGRGPAKGDGVYLKVYLDGKELVTKPFLPEAPDAVVDLNPTVNKGSRIDFAVTPGPAMDTNFDVLGVHIAVLTPEKQ